MRAGWKRKASPGFHLPDKKRGIDTVYKPIENIN